MSCASLTKTFLYLRRLLCGLTELCQGIPVYSRQRLIPVTKGATIARTEDRRDALVPPEIGTVPWRKFVYCISLRRNVSTILTTNTRRGSVYSQSYEFGN